MKTPVRTPASSTSRDVSQVVPSVTALKAIAHPVRLRMLGMLRIDGPATATQLATRLGLNSGATSYHLRQLAQYGFVEDAPGPSRRDRWWRACHEVTSMRPAETEGEAFDVDVAFTQAILSQHVSQMQKAVEEYAELPLAWRNASTASDIIIPLTSEKAEALTKRLNDLLMEAMREAPPLGEPLPPDTVPFTFMLHAFPYPGRLPHGEDESEP
ncbi:ArsR/SmtB family transcription factor [Rhizobium sp. BK377]|uniref:ArsR/SmtB family transcription factor n=1 Tax=Rhizobium sp. BK377 TaxID=2587058 RepID=UPI0016154E41|nr:helix-turn-helix domain-containing protein [Rhizobium sp. BK377]MBB3464639.1 DNA-binding transcriptional ArsR family regulator [Rhizobium sp. BK377]